MKSVLRYPGSKWNLASRIVGMIPDHKSYLEPYFGSGAVLFSKNPSPMETINDLDGDVVNLFRMIRTHPDELSTALYLTPYAEEEYNRAYLREETDDDIEKARKMLIRSLQSHGFSTYRKVGWKIDVQGREHSYAVKHWNEVPEIIKQAADRLKQVQIHQTDAIELIKRFNFESVFMYLDPPYMLETRTRKQYHHEMEDEDHEKLLHTIRNSKARIMISGYDSELYNQKLQGWNRYEFNATAEMGLKRKEVIWTNYRDIQMTINDIWPEYKEDN